MSLAEYKSIAKVGDRVEFTTYSLYRGKITKINDNGFYLDDETSNGKNWGVSWEEINDITLLDDTPDWHTLTPENIREFLAVGDEVEISREKGHSCKEKVKRIDDKNLVCTEVTGSLSCEDYWPHGTFKDAKFRLIKKATPEVAREEPLPHVYTRDEYKVYRPDECCEKIVFFSRGPEVPAEKNTGTLFSHEAWVEEPGKIKYSKPLPNIIKPSDIIKSMSDSIQESLIATARKAKLIAIGITNPDERLAIENGIKEIDGTYTETFYQIVREKERVKKAEADEVARKAKEESDKLMYKSYADAMIADIKAVKAEESKK
jgi:hypothetical protein